MSKNKSTRLARHSGSRLVFWPASGKSPSEEDIHARIIFITLVSGGSTEYEIVDCFNKIFNTFHSEPTVIDQVSKRTGIKKRLWYRNYLCIGFGTEMSIRHMVYFQVRGGDLYDA